MLRPIPSLPGLHSWAGAARNKVNNIRLRFVRCWEVGREAFGTEESERVKEISEGEMTLELRLEE